MDLTETIVAEGTVVSLDYTLTVDNEIVDSSNGKPLEYLQGYHNIIPGLERELDGMQVGETRDIQVASADAYGEYDPEAVYELPKSQFPPSFNLRVGAQLRVRADDGRVLNAHVTRIDGETVKIDLNHPLAGKTLFFRASITAIRPATEDELAAGRLGGSCSSCGTSDGCSGSCS
ncbi:MAG TPA: peptidylprolyl isomerase [Bellilinea sp.]|nr:peptidylprolyl isomerase [Bellilinea sp.]